MGFSNDMAHDLAAPLSSSHVKSREQGGRKVSYVEGWHVIAEANRIFGFDGWSRETVDLKCVAEKERQIGRTNPQPGWGVTYIAKVRLVVHGITREGCGTGHGIDRDLGQAHESALKEAETDAMKRGFMTFGNPFGLALYDKAQTNVADEAGTETIAAHDAALAIAAELGSSALRDRWLVVPVQIKPALKSALDRRHKPRAGEVDRAKVSA